MRHELDLPFRQAAGHFIGSSLNPQSETAVTKNHITFHLSSTLWDDMSDFGDMSHSLWVKQRMDVEKVRAQ